jgi:hypothetical protein
MTTGRINQVTTITSRSINPKGRCGRMLVSIIHTKEAKPLLTAEC